MSNLKAQNQLEKLLGKGRVKENFNLSPYLTLRTDTAVNYYFEAESREDLLNAKRASIELSMPLLIIGGGSNLAITKTNLPVLALRNKYIEKSIKNNLLTVSSGYPVTRLAKETAEDGLEGLEYHFGLPGTVGGALYMNSKWTKPLTYFGDSLVSATLIGEKGKEKKVGKSYFNFAYDYSILQKTKEILIKATFKLKKQDPKILLERLKFAQNYRKLTQPQGFMTCGCFFQNVNGKSAGKLIDQAGLKGYRVGQFYVSDRHANFILNKGNGNPSDLLKLVKLIKARVKKKFGVELKEEAVLI